MVGLGVEEGLEKAVVEVCVGMTAGCVAPFWTKSICCSYTILLVPRLFHVWICSMVVPYVMAILHSDWPYSTSCTTSPSGRAVLRATGIIYCPSASGTCVPLIDVVPLITLG